MPPAADVAGVPTSTTVPAPTSTTLPALSTWTAIAPDPRGTAFYPSVVWTGSEALVVGGVDPAGQPGPVARPPTIP